MRVIIAPLRSLLRYSFSMAHYDNVTYPIADIPGVMLPNVRVSEAVHTPGVSNALTQQLSIWMEYRRDKRLHGTT